MPVCSVTTWTRLLTGWTRLLLRLVRTICGLRRPLGTSGTLTMSGEMPSDLHVRLVGRVGLEPTTQGL